MNGKLLLFAAILSLAAPALRAEDDESEEAPAAEQATEAAPVPAAAPAAEGQALGGTGLRRQKPYKPGQRKAAPAESAGQGASEAEDGEEAEEPVRRRQEARTPVSGGGSGAGGGSSGGPAPAGLRVYESLGYPTFASIPHKGGHPHFTFNAVGEGVAVRFTGTAGGLWQVTPGSDGQDCNARLWVSSGPGGRPVGPECDQPSPPGAPAQNILALDFVSKKQGSACLLRSGQSYYVNMTVSSKWGHCSLYLDPGGSVR